MRESKKKLFKNMKEIRMESESESKNKTKTEYERLVQNTSDNQTINLSGIC